MSGITVHKDCVAEWNNMKLKHMYNFITFRVEDQKEIVVDKTGKGSYESFKANFSPDTCRYAVVEVPGTTKIVFILWAPDSAGIKDKMIYAASRQGDHSIHFHIVTLTLALAALLDQLRGHTKAIQASDLSDIEESRVKSAL